MSETTTYRNIIYRLLPGSKANARRLAGQAGACRFVWNEMLGRHNAAYEAAKESGDKPPSVSFFSLGKEFTALRNATPWLGQYGFTITRYCLKYRADAWKAFFRGEAEHPRFKSKYGTPPSLTIPDKVHIGGDMISIPKIGPMRIRCWVATRTLTAVPSRPWSGRSPANGMSPSATRSRWRNGPTTARLRGLT